MIMTTANIHDGALVMTPTPTGIFNAALGLTEHERLKLAVDLLDSLPSDASMTSFEDPEFLAELERRGDSEEGSMTWEQLRDER
jgi:putative addiction module component (TIGR02574 family)